MDEQSTQTRREFLRICTVSGAGLILAVYTPPGRARARTDDDPSGFVPSVFIRIDPAGKATLTIPRSELAQGVFTFLAMIGAEELDLNWDEVAIENTYADPRFGDQVTGGSTSTRKRWEPLRIAGATARAMLVQAAAARWYVQPSKCTTKDAKVINPIVAFDEMPDVEADIVRNAHPAGGIGELGMGVCPPALCNAIFSATRKRIRTLPITTLSP